MSEFDNREELPDIRMIERERQELPATKSSTTFKYILAGLAIVFAGVSVILYLVGSFFDIREKKEDVNQRIADKGYLVKPQYEKPKENYDSYTEERAEYEKKRASDPLEFTTQKAERNTTEKEPFDIKKFKNQFSADDSDEKVNESKVEPKEGMFDSLLPTLGEDEEKPVADVAYRPGNEEAIEQARKEASERAEETKRKREEEQAALRAKLFEPFDGGDSSLDVLGESDKSSTVLETKLQSTTLTQNKAGFMEDTTYTVAEGTIIPCVLGSRIDTNLPGYIRCTITDNVYGFDGRRVLIPKGTQVYGEYNSGITLGVDRLFVTWSRLRTHNGIIVELNSPGTGNLGESGLGGKIDHRWLRRFGGAFLISLINDSTADSDSEKFEETRATTQDTAMEIIEQYADIPPVLFKNQGDETLIYVSRDLSFKSVYTEVQ